MSDIGQFGIDVETEAAEARDFSPLPDGTYTAIINRSELKVTKAGNGQYLEVAFEIIEGDKKGRLLFHKMNLQNPNPTAEKIGRAELAKLCQACGVDNPKESEQLHDIPVVIKVGLDKNDPKRNAVKGIAPVGDAWEPPKAEAKAAPVKAEVKPAAPVKKPWQK
jgi:hypothetical protein